MTETRLGQFAQDLHQEVLADAGTDAKPRVREETFTESVLERLAEYNESDNTELCFYEAAAAGSLPAARLSAFALSGDGATLDLFITLYHGDGYAAEIGIPDMRRQFKLLRGFLRRALAGMHTRMEESSEAFTAALRIYEAKASLTTVRLFLLTDGVVRSLELEEEKFPGLEVSYIVWDLEKLSQLKVGERAVIDLDFENEYGAPIPCLEMGDATGEYRTYLAFLPGPMLARIYGQHGQRLLERNVRAFLQAKGKVNRGLQRTLAEEPHRFLAYNNGLCCTAAEVRIRADPGGVRRIVWARDFQIVNGGQTTASIYHALKKEKHPLDQVVVQVKLTVLSDPSKIAEIVPLISRFANSQNKVNAADFAANGPFHQKLEEKSRTIWAPAVGGLERGSRWFYERSRGSYADSKARQRTAADRRKWEAENPPNQRFTKTDLAKFEHAWMGLPHLVCLGAEKNFMKFAERMEADGEPVVDQAYFRHAAAKTILCRTAEKLFDTKKLEGYRANSVAYAVAWLAERSQRRIDLEQIWKTQRLTPALCDAVKQACAEAHRFITGQEGNPGEASKRESCWLEFKGKAIDTDEKWLDELASAPFEPSTSEEESLTTEWEAVRHQFINDYTTVGELEALTGINWVATRRGDPVGLYAQEDWARLRAKRGLGLIKLRTLVQICTAAARR